MTTPTTPTTPSRPPTHLTSKAFYLVAIGLIASAVTMAIVGFTQMLSTVENLQRVQMPGRAEIMLPAGASALYVESRSVIGGKPLEVSGEFQYRCGIDEPTRKATLTKTTTTVEYSIGDYAGAAAWDVEVEQAGRYVLVCEAPQPFAVAVGRGVGAWIVIAVVGLVPFMIGVVIILVVFFKRRRQLRAR